MSTFGGKIKEIPGISVDRFDHKNLDSEVYFLSHCHTDHMKGLNTLEFQGTLKERNCYIYVSPVSKAILKRIHPNIDDQIKELDFFAPTSIYLKNGVLSVIPIPSGHCPGSVMFLFEVNRNILYTGDYRMKSSDLQKMRAFYNSYGDLKKIDTIYLDTTFFLQSHLEFPTREESLEEICNLIEDWLAMGEKYIVNICTSARYGYEYLFMEISKRTNMPVHVGEEAYSFYSLIPDMDNSVTLDSSLSKIHCSCGTTYRNICITNKTDYLTRTIKVSAMRWTNNSLKEGLTSDNQYGTYFVCYSTHASYNEGRELIKFLKPKEIQPCVLRDDDHTNNEIFSNIEQSMESEDGCPSKKLKLFDINKIEKEKLKKSDPDNDNENSCGDLFDSALESPPKVDTSE